MNRPATALFAAVEAVVTVAVGVGIALVPLTLLWGIEYGLQVPWSVFWRAAGSIWLLGHGVDVTFVLDAATAKATGLTGAGAPIVVTIAALGFALLTAWLGARAGRRLAETEHRATGLLAGIVVVAVLSVLVALSSISVASRPSLWQAVVLPTLWYAVPAIVAAEVARRRRRARPDPVTARALDLVDRIPSVWRAMTGVAFRGGVGVVAVLVAAAAVLVALLLLGSYAEVITLYEQSHAGVVGGLAITVGELAFLPDLVGWAMSWIVGPGFAIGSGSDVSPIGTVLGPIPGIPVFGALPARGHAFGLLSVLVPAVGGFLVAAVLRPGLVRSLGDRNGAGPRALAGVGVGVVAGVLTGLAAWLSAGALGPGRLVTVGPAPLAVGALAALEAGVPAVLALAVGSDLVRLPERGAWRRERWHDDEADATPVLPVDTITEDDDGGFLGALDRAGAGRGHTGTAGPGGTGHVDGTGPVGSAGAHHHRFRVTEPGSGVTVAHPGDETQPLTDDERDPDVVRELERDREREREAALPPLPLGWAARTERAEQHADTADDGARAATAAPADPTAADDRDHWDTDVVDEIPEHELPWWRRPKGDPDR